MNDMTRAVHGHLHGEALPAEEKQPRLDRKTRGQVRRVANRLATVERKVFQSESSPGKTYLAVVHVDGKVMCDCRGWTVKKDGKPRQSRHTKELIDGRAVHDDGDFQYLNQYDGPTVTEL